MLEPVLLASLALAFAALAGFAGVLAWRFHRDREDLFSDTDKCQAELSEAIGIVSDLLPMIEPIRIGDLTQVSRRQRARTFLDRHGVQW